MRRDSGRQRWVVLAAATTLLAATDDGRARTRAPWRAATTAGVAAEPGGPVPHAMALRPLTFERNEGQADAAVRYLARGSGYTLFLTATGAVLSLTASAPGDTNPKHLGPEASKERSTQVRLRLTLVGANPWSEGEGADESAGKSHYLVGPDPGKWRTNVANYAKVAFRDVYPGIDLVYYGNQRQLEHDWVLAPGAEPSAIRFAVEGADNTAIDASGDLVVATAAGDVRLHAPVAYQEAGGKRQAVAGAFAARGPHEFGFEVGAYDRTRPLVIDPVLSYSTYLGGSGWDDAYGIAVDSSGSAYLTGSTTSIDLPVAGPFQGVMEGVCDVFVTKLTPSGALAYSTYLGGNSDEVGSAIAVDATGHAYVTGHTESTDFPTRNPRQPVKGDFYDAFLVKLDPSGSRLVYSTYHGGSANDFGRGVAVDASGRATITGDTNSSNLPTYNGDPVPGGSIRYRRAFVTRFDPAGGALVYSRYLGDNDGQSSGYAIAVDSGGAAYVTGTAESSGFNSGGLQPARNGVSDAFLAMLDPSGNQKYATYLGGSGTEYGSGVAVDAWGNVYLTGSTTSANFPTAGALQATRRGASDAFVTKLNALGNALVYSTYLGGGDDEAGTDLAIDAWGHAYVVGYTGSANFPTSGALQPALAGRTDAFVTTLDRWGSRLVFSTYHGGGSHDWPAAIAVDASGQAYISGYTESSDFPTANPWQGAHAGQTDAFALKIAGIVVPDAARLEARPSVGLPGATVTATWSGVPTAAANDWIGLYESWRAVDGAFLARFELYGRQSGSQPVDIPEGAAFGATYELRLFGNGGVTRLATSNCFTVQTPTLKVLNDRISAGRSATVSWGYVVRPTSADWVGLYASPAVDDSEPLAVQATNGRDSGSLSLGVPADTPTGTTYQVRLFRGSGARLAASPTFAIWHPTLTVSPTMVRPGGIVIAAWADLPNPSATDWIGLYRSASVADSEYLRQQDTSGSANGSATFPIPPDALLGSAYELRLFRGGSSTPVARSNSFRVERASLRVNPTPILAGLPVVATWSGIPAPSGRDWIGLYASSGAPNSPSISWIYIPALTNGSVLFAIPGGLEPGTTYELRLFRNDGYSRLATSPPFTVRQP